MFSHLWLNALLALVSKNLGNGPLGFLGVIPFITGNHAILIHMVF